SPNAPPTSMNPQLSRADQLEKRLITFAVAILSLSAKLPRTPQGRHISSQILRSGNSVAANYGEARGAESRQDFIHKLRVVFKEPNKTTIWREVITESPMPPTDTTAPIVAETRKLCRVIAPSIKTARAS